MFDGINIEERAEWVPETNQIGGLCREHSHRYDVHVENIGVIESIAEMLNGSDPTIHLGKEATVVAIGAYRPTHYEAISIAVSATCKKDTGADIARIIRTSIQAWKENPDGEAKHGPLWAAASDGDGTFRRALHSVLMVKKLDPESDLGMRVCPLLGMNIETGDGDMTIDGDFKHEGKREFHADTCYSCKSNTTLGFATSLRGRDLVVFNMVLGATIFIKYLQRLPDVSLEDAINILDPADHQNVSRAITLLQSIIKLRYLRPDSPGEAEELRALTILGHVLDSFVTPFTTTKTTLSLQLTALSKYAHLIYVLFRMHGTSFMTSQLYIDTQATVKNTFFCVAKQQLLDPTQPFLLMLTGDDCIEVAFGEVRTQNHASNFSLLELVRKLTIAVMCHRIFQAKPHLDAGHKRLNLPKTGTDHMNPASFDLTKFIVGDVSLLQMWRHGRMEAMKVFEAGLIPNVESHLSLLSDDGYDMMHPHGESRCPGVSDIEIAEDGAEVALPATKTAEPEQGVQVPEDNFLESDEEVAPFAISLEDAVVTDEVQREDPEAAKRHFLLFNGREVHKSSLVSIACKAGSKKKSTERLMRVRGYLKSGERKKGLNDEEITGSSSVQPGETAATLVKSGDGIYLAIVRMAVLERTGADVRKIALPRVSREEFETSQVLKVSGQVLIMKQMAPFESDANPHWQWDRNFVIANRHDSTGTKLLPITASDLSISFLAKRCILLDMDVVIQSEQATFSISDRELYSIRDILWASLHPQPGSSAEEQDLELGPPVTLPTGSDELGLQTLIDLMPELVALPTEFPYVDLSSRSCFSFENHFLG